jgi:cytochrome c-type biogenesis protein CcmH/NrfG
MADTKTSTSSFWTGTQAYLLSAICLFLGLAVGYLVRGSATPSAEATKSQATASGSMGSGGASEAMTQQPTPEQMRHMADTQAEPLLAQLKSDPNNIDLIYKLGNIYYDTQQFPEAVKYYEQALKINPKATDVRTDMATAYHFMGQSDRAIQEFDEVLKIDSKHANALFNEGMVKWQDKMDMKGAIAAWKHLLTTNPDYPQKDRVEALIAKAEQHLTMKPGTKTDKPAEIAR